LVDSGVLIVIGLVFVFVAFLVVAGRDLPWCWRATGDGLTSVIAGAGSCNDHLRVALLRLRVAP